MTTPLPDPEDLTARARIRDAAAWHFGESGFEGATIRGIAETAGVSSGLLRHHFGSKQALREACDEHLVKLIRRLDDSARADPVPGMNPLAAARLAMGPYQRYLTRALTEGWAAPVFDQMVEVGETWLTEADSKRPDQPYADRRVRAALIVAMALAVPVLHQHLSRVLGIDALGAEGDATLARALLDIYSHPMLSPDEAATHLDLLNATVKEYDHD
ncbi:TetR/AcrR family transcriptional regulator [Nonomuraea sp. NPDC050383]|uniref:TetR/AcrR family transcriptional regulator n=1 Tax=Nonomuraea sp. NPDC050383 TaxID=3364362 RepID=UPI0037B38782